MSEKTFRMEDTLDELNSAKREVCAAVVQRSTSLDSMPPPSNMSTLQFLNNGSSSSSSNKNDDRATTPLLPAPSMVPVNNSMPPGSQPCPVQRSRSLPLLDQSPLNTDDILAELADRSNAGGNVSSVGDGMDQLGVDAMGQQDGSLNGADDSGSNQEMQHQDYSTGPSTPTTPHHIPPDHTGQMHLPLNHQELSPPPNSVHMSQQPLNLSQSVDSKFFSQSFPPNPLVNLRPNQGREFLSQQQALPANWTSGLPDTRFPFRNTDPFASYPSLSLSGLTQGRSSPFASYSLIRDSDKPAQFPADVYNSIGLPQSLHFSRSLMQLQQAPFVRSSQLVRDVEPSLDETVRVVSSIAGDPVENNNILKSSSSVQQAFNDVVSITAGDKYPLPGNLAMSMAEISHGSPLTVGQKSNSPALRLKQLPDQMLSMINNYSDEQLLSGGGNLMSNSPVMMDESFLTSAMTSGGMSRLQETPNLPAVDNQSPTVNSEPAFDLLGGGGDVEDANFMSQGISPQPQPLGLDQSGEPNTSSLLNYTTTSQPVDMKRMSTVVGNNNQQLTGANPGDGPSKPKKGRPRAGAPGHRYSQPCPTCGKVFGSSSALAKHKLIHSSERRHKCILCAKSFKRQDHLTGHMLTHRSRKPYECTVENCNKSYCDIRSLRRHFESQHPGLVMEDNMNYTGDEKDPELIRAEEAARQAQSQNQNFPNSASPAGQQADYIVNYSNSSPPTAAAGQDSDSPPGSSSSAALQYLAQAAQRATTLSTLASVAEGHNLALANNQESANLNLTDHPPPPSSSYASDISSHFLPGSSHNLQNPLGSIPSGSSGLTVPGSLTREQGVVPGAGLHGYHQPEMMPSPPKKSNAVKPPKSEKERTMVKCSICSKTFKSMPALNGHMRLHGGYNSTRTATPPVSNPEQNKRQPKQIPSQVPSSFAPNNMDFQAGSYSHQMVMQPHNMGVPPPQQSSPPNMVSFVGRYPPPENTYRPGVLPSAQQVMGASHPGSMSMSHHLLQPPTLIQTHHPRSIEYNLPRQPNLSTSYPSSGLSSLSQAAIKLETEAKTSCQLPDKNAAVLNLSAPRRGVMTPSPPALEAETKCSLPEDPRLMLDRKSPLLLPHPSYQIAGNKERDQERDVFRDPTPVQVSPPKRKPRPPSLFIPAWATTGNPGGIVPSAFHSQMRSPREIGAGFMYRTNSTTPPPYTPPPMLSPIRSGSGLYFSASVTGSSRGATPAVPGSTPTTPSMLQFHRRASNSGPPEETSDLVFSSEPHINVGPDFQAVVPELEKDSCPQDEDEREGTIMWSTETNKLYPEVEVHYFLDLACTPTLPGGARNTEFAHHCLQHAKGDIEIALMMLLNQKPLLPKNVEVNGYRYDFATPWSQSERKAFRDMYKAKGKDFHEIQKGIPSKSAKDCVEYYYFWKKLYPYNADMQKFCHHSGLNPNEEMRRQECDLFPDETFLDYVPLKEYRSDKYGHITDEEPTSKPVTSKPANSSDKSSAKSDGQFLCSYPNCQASFKSRQALNGHIRVHGGLYKGDKSVPKPKPRVPSASDSSEEDEDEEEEEEEEEERQSSGNEGASSSEDMSDDDNLVYPCKICGKEFSKIKSRSAHMKSHRKVEKDVESSIPSESLEEKPRPSFSSSLSDGEVDEEDMGWESESSSNNGNMDESMSSEGEMSG